MVGKKMDGRVRTRIMLEGTSKRRYETKKMDRMIEYSEAARQLCFHRKYASARARCFDNSQDKLQSFSIPPVFACTVSDSSLSMPTCHGMHGTRIVTHIADIGPIDVVHDIHEPEHGQQVLVNLAHEGLFGGRVGDVGVDGGIFDRARLVERVDVLGLVLFSFDGLHLVEVAMLYGVCMSYEGERRGSAGVVLICPKQLTGG